MPELKTHKDANMNVDLKESASDTASDSEAGQKNSMEEKNNKINANEHSSSSSNAQNVTVTDRLDEDSSGEKEAMKDIDQTLDDDVNYQEQLDECNDSLMQSTESKGNTFGLW